MINEKVQAFHQFTPKLLRRQVAAALEARKAFEDEQYKKVLPMLLANRNAWIAKRKRNWFFRSVKHIPTVEQCVALSKDKEMMAWFGNIWNNDHDSPLRAVFLGPKYNVDVRALGVLNHGKRWVDEIRQLHHNMKDTAQRRVTVSADLYHQIRYWSSKLNG